MNVLDSLGLRDRIEDPELASRWDLITRTMILGPDAAARLAAELGAEIAGRHVAVLYDQRTREVGGREVAAALAGAGWTVSERCLEDGEGGSWPVCDDVTKARLQRDFPTVDACVAAGSGVVNDLTKWLAAEAGVPYAVLATAASMNGYSAANVAPTILGVKSLFKARAPRIIAATPSTLAAAPYALTAAGLGDVIAKPVSTADWIMNRELFGESYSPVVAGIIDEVEPRYLDRPDALAARSEEAVGALFEALVLSGCAMTLQGSSLPASGGEHLISHTLDMLSHLDGRPHDLHGRQVGVATIIAAALYQRILALEEPVLRPDSIRFDPSVWGRIAGAVEPEHRAKARRLAEACELLASPRRWDGLRAELAAAIREPSAIKSCLRRAGAAHRLADIGCSRERFLTALQSCSGIRGRFTSVDLAYATGVLPDQAGDLIDEWLVD